MAEKSGGELARSPPSLLQTKSQRSRGRREPVNVGELNTSFLTWSSREYRRESNGMRPPRPAQVASQTADMAARQRCIGRPRASKNPPMTHTCDITVVAPKVGGCLRGARLRIIKRSKRANSSPKPTTGIFSLQSIRREATASVSYPNILSPDTGP